MGKRGFTIVEFLVTIALIVILASVLVPVLGRAREAVRRASCANNLRQHSIALKVYAGESIGGKYPPLATYFAPEVDCDHPQFPLVEFGAATVFFWNPDMMAPDFVSDHNILLCPSDVTGSVDALTNRNSGRVDVFEKCIQPTRGWRQLNGSYEYFGHVYDKVDDIPENNVPLFLFEFMAGFKCRPVDINEHVNGQFTAAMIEIFLPPPGLRPKIVDDDLDLEVFDGLTFTPIGTGNSTTLYRLREGIERFLITDVNNPGASVAAQSKIQVMWDQASVVPAVFNHIPGGSNVLHLDGHVDFIKYPGAGFVSKPAAIAKGCVKK